MKIKVFIEKALEFFPEVLTLLLQRQFFDKDFDLHSIAFETQSYLSTTTYKVGLKSFNLALTICVGKNNLLSLKDTYAQ